MAFSPLRVAPMAGLAGALTNLVSAPFHAAAYFATEEGRTELFPHQEAAGAWLREAVPAAFAAGPDAAYLTWGKFTALAMLLYATAFVLLQHGVAPRAGRLPRVAGRIAAGAWVLFALFSTFLFFGALLDAVFVVMVLTILVALVSTATYGVLVARRRLLQRRVGALLVGAAIAVVPLVVLAGHIPLGFLGFAVAWIAIAATLLPRGAPEEAPVAG